jgi:AcrR family transcriptional regulator
MADLMKQISPWKPMREREKERRTKRDAVLRMAAQSFNEKGFHATSLDDVAARLNVTKPTLYYYFKNKEEILFECVRIGLEMIDEAAENVARRGGTGVEQLFVVMRKYAEIVTMDFGMCLIRVGEDPLQPAARRKLRQLKARIDRRFRSLIEQGIAEGDLAPCDAKIAAFTVAGALSWIARWYRPDGSLSPNDIAEQCISILVEGLVRRAEPLPGRGRSSAMYEGPSRTK